MEDPQQRRARLKALREAAAVRGEDKAEEHTQATPANLKFRNYAVRDQKIQHTVVEPAQPPKFEAPKPEAEVERKPEDVLANVAPKKPNWDLRRDVEKKLAKLERRTQRALVQLAQRAQAQETQ